MHHLYNIHSDALPELNAMLVIPFVCLTFSGSLFHWSLANRTVHPTFSAVAIMPANTASGARKGAGSVDVNFAQFLNGARNGRETDERGQGREERGKKRRTFIRVPSPANVDNPYTGSTVSGSVAD